MNLLLSYVPWLVDLNFRKTLTVSLFALVLLAALFLEDDDLIVLAVANNGHVQLARTALAAGEKRLDLDLLAFLSLDRRHTHSLPAFDSELLATCPDNCVTHLFRSR